MKITLDTNALKYLMDSDPQFVVEVKRNITAGLIRAVAERDAPEIVNQIAPELMAELKKDTTLGFTIREIIERAAKEMISYVRTYNGEPIFKPTDKTRTQIARALQPVIQDATLDLERKAVAAANLRIADMAERITKTVDERVDRAIDTQLEYEINKRVAERLSQALAIAAEKKP